MTDDSRHIVLPDPGLSMLFLTAALVAQLALTDALRRLDVSMTAGSKKKVLPTTIRAAYHMSRSLSLESAPSRRWV